MKHQFLNGCFNWMIPNLYIGNAWKSQFPSTQNWLAFGYQAGGYMKPPQKNLANGH